MWLTKTVNMKTCNFKNTLLIRSLLIHILILVVFSNSVLNWACFCGKDCSHGFNKLIKADGFLHNRCSDAQCKSCNFENSNAIKAFNGILSTVKQKFDVSLFIIYNSTRQYHNFSKHIQLHSFFLKNSSPPAYIKFLHLLL